MSTFDGQSSLPKLPIPPLEDTCKRYLLAVTPLLTKQELATTTAAVERFLATDGPALQKSLCEYAADKSSYVEDFWFDAYLSGSSSVVLNINPYFVLEDDPTPSNNDQVNRAASLTMSALQFISSLRAGTLARLPGVRHSDTRPRRELRSIGLVRRASRHCGLLRTWRGQQTSSRRMQRSSPARHTVGTSWIPR